MTGTVLSGERAPRRRDLPNWLKENPDYEVEGDMLEVDLPGRLCPCLSLPMSQLKLWPEVLHFVRNTVSFEIFTVTVSCVSPPLSFL